MMKKILLLCLFSLLAVGCGSVLNQDHNSENQNSEQNNERKEAEVQLPLDQEKDSSDVFLNEYKTILMENVDSSDILLHDKISITSIEFSVRDSLSYSAGKDIYLISYLSSAKPDELYDTYVDYMDTVTEESSNEYNRTIEGMFNQRPISVSFPPIASANQEEYWVRIRISEEPSKFEEENRYFSEYPNLVELYKLDSENNPIYHMEKSYLEAYIDGIKTYKISFHTSANHDDFTKFYRENYSQKTDFKDEEDEYQQFFSWLDSGYEHKIALTKSNNMVGVEVITQLP